ncbi:hypothetical protein CPB83DRAFT_906006 [Crepidotus variabilis]|uniref:Uncharacterized protein n=1 Tax=Crepidotus variabilis TaxID=179855 RepID=A0A9P6EHA5_9AGAR|nr:hypothetical protein CPB83DRAFT_906006 [Crepidotus variabilis]
MLQMNKYFLATFVSILSATLVVATALPGDTAYKPVPCGNEYCSVGFTCCQGFAGPICLSGIPPGTSCD